VNPVVGSLIVALLLKVSLLLGTGWRNWGDQLGTWLIKASILIGNILNGSVLVGNILNGAILIGDILVGDILVGNQQF
jgi:hypothetical protein